LDWFDLGKLKSWGMATDDSSPAETSGEVIAEGFVLKHQFYYLISFSVFTKKLYALQFIC
jgi:hypothetical protein